MGVEGSTGSIVGTGVAASATRMATEQSLIALAAALATGAIALASPPAALMALAMLGARALLNCRAVSLDIASIAPPLAAAGFLAIALGPAAGMGLILAWRMWAETRWSVHEAQHLAHAAGRPNETSWRALVHAWTTPLYALAVVAYTAPHMVAGLPLDLPHVPIWAPVAAGLVAALSVFDWALRRSVDWRLGQLAEAPAAHLLAHHTLFLAAFGLMIDVSAGVVALAAWRLALSGRAHASLTAVP